MSFLRILKENARPTRTSNDESGHGDACKTVFYVAPCISLAASYDSSQSGGGRLTGAAAAWAMIPHGALAENNLP